MATWANGRNGLTTACNYALLAESVPTHHDAHPLQKEQKSLSKALRSLLDSRVGMIIYAKPIKPVKGFTARRNGFRMSKAEIIAELPRLSHRERREIIQCILDMEQEAHLLADCDRRADERFLMLDAMEAEDGQTPTG